MIPQRATVLHINDLFNISLALNASEDLSAKKTLMKLLGKLSRAWLVPAKVSAPHLRYSPYVPWAITAATLGAAPTSRIRT